MAASRLVKSFVLIRIVTMSGLLFLTGMLALVFFAKMEEQVIANGTVEPRDAVEIRGRRSSTISRVLVQPGQVVAEGDVLIKLGSSRVRNELGRAEDRLAKAKAQLGLHQAQLERLAKNPLPEKLRFADEELVYAKAAHDVSQKELARARKLSTDGLLSQSELDSTLVKYQADLNRYRLAKRKHDLVAAGLEDSIVKEAQAQLKLTRREIVNLEHEIERWKANLAKCTFKAPVAGQIVAVYKKDGESVAPGELLAALATSSRTQLKLLVGEQEIYKVELGQLTRIYSSVYSYRKYGTCTGEVSEVAKWADRTGGKSVYEVVIDVEEAPFPLLLGSSAMARIVVARRGILDMLLDWG